MLVLSSNGIDLFRPTLPLGSVGIAPSIVRDYQIFREQPPYAHLGKERRKPFECIVVIHHDKSITDLIGTVNFATMMVMENIWTKAPEWAKRLTAVIAAITALSALLTTIFPWDPIKTTIALTLGGVAIMIFGSMCDHVTQRVDEKIDGMEKRMIARDKEQETSLKRLELMTLIAEHPENKVEIEKVAKYYFIDLKGDWYATELFSKWATEHGVDVGCIITEHH